MRPLSFPIVIAISNGIALGLIADAIIKTLSDRGKDVSIRVYLLAALFTAKFIFF